MLVESIRSSSSKYLYEIGYPAIEGGVIMNPYLPLKYV